MNPIIKEKLTRLPREPGAYLMKDAKGAILYVGKAKSLKSRVSSYFGDASRLAWKTRALMREVYDFDVMITKTPVEALLLERTLIKHHQPRFNILLRDDKEYPFLRIDFAEAWPRIEKVRRRKEDGAVYLGPFGSAGQLKILLDATYRIFPLIRCSRHEFDAAKRPCNYYHMRMCLAPCTKDVSKAEYVEMVRHAVDFLRGRNKQLVRALKDRMTAAAEGENYELAALLRDQLNAFEQVTEKQAVVVEGTLDADVVGYVTTDTTRAAFSVMMVRDGYLVSNDAFVVESPVAEGGDALTEFLIQFYDGRSLPPEIFLPLSFDGEDELRLALLAGHPDAARLTLKSPERGVRHDLVEMANKNAAYRLEELTRLGERRRAELEVVRDKLKLARIPQRMECIDISNTQGVGIVASNVCFVGGKPAKEHYRHYRIQDVSGAPDDYASIREVVRRRLERARRDGDLPDLLVIDGGKGQLSAAMDARTEFPDLAFDLVSLAKSRVDKRTDSRSFIARGAAERSFERVFFPHEELPLPLAPGTPEYRMMTQIRDEAHRFAITHHRKLRGKISHGSALTDIPGIGPALRKKLIETFGGLDGLRRARLDQLKSVKGLRESAAVALHAYLRADEDKAEEDSDLASRPEGASEV
jgi:excinuclease ABC subunit C